MKKVVLKVDLHDDKAKQKAIKAVSTVSGIDSISMDMKEKKLTVIGAMDPVHIVSKLRKHWDRAMILSVGPAKEPEKKEEPKKEEPKKEEPKKEEAENKKLEPKKEEAEKKKEEPKEEPKKEDGEKKDEPKKEEPKKDEAEKKEEPKKEAEGEKKKDPNEQVIAELVNAYRAYNPHMTTHYYVQSIEENPNSCIIS